MQNGPIILRKMMGAAEPVEMWSVVGDESNPTEGIGRRWQHYPNPRSIAVLSYARKALVRRSSPSERASSFSRVTDEQSATAKGSLSSWKCET